MAMFLSNMMVNLQCGVGFRTLKAVFLFANISFFCLHELFLLYSEPSKPFILVELNIV